MKTILEYLLSKKQQTAISTEDIREYCIALVFDNIDKEYEDIFNDAKFPNNANSQPELSYYWILPLDIAKEYEDKFGGITLYQIPDFCHTIEQVKTAGKDGRLDIDDLELIDEYE